MALARPSWGDAAWSFLYGRDTRYGGVEPEEGEVAAANRRMRNGDDARRSARAVHQGAGVDLGGAGLLLGRRHRLGDGVRRARRRSRGRRVVGRGRAQGRARRGAAGAGAADRRPRAPGALPQHVAHLQAALADEHGRVVPGRFHGRRRRCRGSRPARAAPDGTPAGRGQRVARRLPRLLHRRVAGGYRSAGVGAQPHLPRADLRLDRDRHRRRRHAPDDGSRGPGRGPPDPPGARPAGGCRNSHRADALDRERAPPRARRRGLLAGQAASPVSHREAARRERRSH